jgi:hypothetical protein
MTHESDDQCSSSTGGTVSLEDVFSWNMVPYVVTIPVSTGELAPVLYKIGKKEQTDRP